jgi:YD repeat-containing protein
MRRNVAGLLFLVLIGLGSVAAFARTKDRIGPNLGDLRGVVAAATSDQTSAQTRLPIHPIIHRARAPQRPRPDYANPARYATLIAKPHMPLVAEPLTPPIDLVKLRKIQRREFPKSPQLRLLVSRAQGKRGQRAGASLTPATTGLLRWWTYDSRTVPGIGEALVNVANLNFLIVANDMDIPKGDLHLAFRRVYNSQSQHDKGNDDNSTPSVFGNKWTNNYDAHLGWTQIDQNDGTVSVYTGDGSREDFECAINGTSLCVSQTTGAQDSLAAITLSGNVACQFQWTKKSGVAYIFTAPYQACGKLPGAYGRLVEICGRNISTYVTLSYSWAPDASSPENISQIVVTHHPDLATLTMNFGQIKNTSITELTSIVMPDNSPQNPDVIDYKYNVSGGLNGVDKPDGDPVLPVQETLPTTWPDGQNIPAGNLPETYDIEAAGLLEACGPRAAIGSLPPNGSPTDGACVDFDYVSNTNELVDWWTRGVLNPYPEDDVSYSNIQSGPNTGFVQWDDTTFFNNNEGNCNPYAEAGASDLNNHAVSWCYDSNGRVVETATAVSTTQTLYTFQTWDNNNNLTSVTDARGSRTDMAYDPNGNVVEISLPPQNVNPPNQTLRPTYLFDYDQYNNLTYYCDPANNPTYGWSSSQSDALCENSGSTYFTTYAYNHDKPNEPYGCLIKVTTPRSYHWQYTYAGGGSVCGLGLPTTIAGDTIMQDDKSQRTPTQSFTYYNDGMLEYYSPTGSNNNQWTISYTANGLNGVRSVKDPDGVTSYSCYNPNGSVFYTETAYQHSLDPSTGCPTNAQIANGATPLPYAAGNNYDPDGNVATVTRHHGCWASNGSFSSCAASTPAPTNCYGSSVPDGTTCNFYDGLERLVEVKQPYDVSRDLYTSPWITRYLYDLSEGGTQQFYDKTFAAYGNLFEVQERLPVSPTSSATASPGSIPNGVNQPIKAWAYDGLDRPVDIYAAVGTNPSYTSEQLSWDTNFINGDNISGLLGQDCNSASPKQCQQFDYTADGELMKFLSTDGSSPSRNYFYDADGHPTKITSSAFSNPQMYSYGPDGNAFTSTDASNNDQGTSSALLTHHRYLDGSEESLDVSSGALNQTGLFSYSYTTDGRLQTKSINDGSVTTVSHHGTTTVSYNYTAAGRLSARSESGVDASPGPSASVSYLPNLELINKMTYSRTTLSQFTFTAEDELVQLNDPQCSGVIIYAYTVRAELSSSTTCGKFNGGSYFANGLAVPGGQGTFNDLMAVLLSEPSNSLQSTWTYGSSGRMGQQAAPYPFFSPPATVTTARTYDAENHINTTTFESPAPNPSAWPYVQVTWGPDGHPAVVGSSKNGTALKNERLHWNGDQLLFTTNMANGSLTLDDIKVDTQGDILPGDTYSGLTFYDRGPGGMILGCHNQTGTSYVGFSDGGWAGFGRTPCSQNLQPTNAKMPTSTVWSESPYSTYQSGGAPTVGFGGTLGMMRPDGFTDGFDTIQGDRAFDSTSGLWTTPDKYPADTYDPASLKSYIWNGNNPIDFMDPTGNDKLLIGFASANVNVFGAQQYHAFGMLVDDNGSILQIYSFGPQNASVNNEYHDVDYAGYVINGGVYANSLFVAGNCAGVCRWEPDLNKAYFGWPNDWIVYAGFINSNTGLSWILRQAGLPSGLPAWAPDATGWIPGGDTCGGSGPGTGEWNCGSQPGHFFPGANGFDPELSLGPGLTAAMYAIYGGAVPTSVDIVCNGNWACYMQY